MTTDILIVGAGVFGVFTAIELARRDYKVTLIESGEIPNPKAASTDISKVVRVEYGADHEYFKMAEASMTQWRKWNEVLNEEVYHEVGFMMLSQNDLDQNRNGYESHSLKLLEHEGFKIERIKGGEIHRRFPSLSPVRYEEAVFNPRGGYVKSGWAIELLTRYAQSIGVLVLENEAVSQLLIEEDKVKGVQTIKGHKHFADQVVVSAGSHTPYLLPELQPYFRITGHPIFWLQADKPELFSEDNFPVFMADIAHTGYYGFPYNKEEGVLKISKHAAGTIEDPDGERLVTQEEIEDMRAFVKTSFPSLIDAPIKYMRKCLYTDTLDGHYWIDCHPTIKGLTVSTGGSGHGMKMGPELGRITADVVEGFSHGYSNRYAWRHISKDEVKKEEARLGL